MKIYLDRTSTKQIKLSAEDAIEEGDTDTLREDMMEAFTEDQIEEIERRADSSDFYEMLTDMLDEWSGDDAAELFELLEGHLADSGIELKFYRDALLGEEDDDSADEAESDGEVESDADDSDNADDALLTTTAADAEDSGDDLNDDMDEPLGEPEGLGLSRGDEDML